MSVDKTFSACSLIPHVEENSYCRQSSAQTTVTKAVKKKQGSQKTDSPYRELNETLSFFSIIIVFKKKTIGPFNVVQLISLPKPEDKHHHAERDEVVSYRIVYKDSIYLSQMQALPAPGPILTDLVHNSFPSTVF